MCESKLTKRALFCVIASVLLVIVLAGCGESDQVAAQPDIQPIPTATIQPTAKPTATPTPDITQTPAYQLASIDAAGMPDLTTVERYQKALTELSDKTGNSEVDIANATVNGLKILRDHQKDSTLIALLDGVNAAITKADHQTYNEALAALITIMEN